MAVKTLQGFVLERVFDIQFVQHLNQFTVNKRQRGFKPCKLFLTPVFFGARLLQPQGGMKFIFNNFHFFNHIILNIEFQFRKFDLNFFVPVGTQKLRGGYGNEHHQQQRNE